VLERTFSEEPESSSRPEHGVAGLKGLDAAERAVGAVERWKRYMALIGSRADEHV
jgi:hypothetical protein